MSSPAIRQESSVRPGRAAADLTTRPESSPRTGVRYSDLVRIGSRIGRPWFRFISHGQYMVEVGWEGGGPNTTHCISELTVIRSNDRFACI